MNNRRKNVPPVLNEIQRKRVHSIYYTEGGVGSYGTPENLYKAVRKDDKTITLRAVKDWWTNQRKNVFTKKFPYSAFPASVSLRYAYTNPIPMRSLSMDTMFLPGTRTPVVFIAIDNFTAYAFAEPASFPATAEKAEAALRLFLSPEYNVGVQVKVSTFYSDEGAEYIARTFNKYLNSLGIHHYYMKGQNKAFKAERAIRTFRSYLKRFRAALKGPLLYKHIRTVMASYNNNYSRAVGMSPFEARLPENLEKVQKFKAHARLKSSLRNYQTFQKVPIFEKGDYVLLRRRKGDVMGAKESDLHEDVNVYQALFQVTAVVPDYPSKSYRLLNLDKGTTYQAKVPATRLIRAPEYYIQEKTQH